MSINDIIRAWTDASFRKSLEAQGIKVPANPAGESALDNDGLLTDDGVIKRLQQLGESVAKFAAMVTEAGGMNAGADYPEIKRK